MHQNTGNHIYQIQNCVASLSSRLVEVCSHVALQWLWWKMWTSLSWKLPIPALQRRCVDINTKDDTNNRWIKTILSFHISLKKFNGQIFPASSCSLLQNGSRKRVGCICITTIWLADGSAAAWKVEKFSTFWRRPRIRMDGRSHNAFHERH